jgi:hypothetical protein
MQKLIDYFIQHPKQLSRSSGKFVRGERGGDLFRGTKLEDVTEAKRQAREILNGQIKVNQSLPNFENKKLQNIVESETDHNTGNQRITLTSDKPLSPKEIEELVGVDKISTFVDRSWLKSHKNGTWTYSILTVCKIKDFYTSVELDEKLKQLFKKEQPNFTGLIPDITPNNKALFIYISDDHCGLILNDSLHGKEYSGLTYVKRLQKITNELLNLKETFSELYIIRLGDEMDGWNGKTTRYDHDLNSLSNKQQFDIYTIANKIFYDEIFTLGIAKNYNIITLGNSNHTGLGFSYIANKALSFWIEAKFPFVKIKQQEKFIDVLEFGNHIIGLTHGKDEKYMKSPMPLNLDYKTDLWLMDYYKQYQQQGKYISTIKGDIHKHNINYGKSGRYVNVPAIATNSSWVEHNFGDSDAGILLEIYEADNKNIQSIPIWF